MSHTEGWIEHHPGDAAWVQAIGATLAVATAVLIPAMQARYARRQRDADRDLRAKSLAIAIYPDLLHIRLSCRHIRRYLQTEIDDAQQRRLGGAAEIDVTEHAKRLTVPISEALRAMVPQFYLLGEPIGPEVQKCIGRSMKFNDLVHNMSAVAFQATSPQLLQFIEQALAGVESCIAAIEQTWGVSAPEADVFEKQLAGAIESAAAMRSETTSKESV
ncbi:MAG TPA: hypothetical protein VMB73_22015 [Acetobacteraceae bacterium]|jgi:hypothetical protein|nr:hypothetical protein [Acetobacteraceae bacterium]